MRTREVVPPDEQPLAAALRRVGDRWSLLVIDALLGGPRRFNELAEQIDGIATNVLTQRLRHLEEERLVLATPYSRRPPRYAYELTGTGRALAGALHLLADWGAGAGSDGGVPTHALCGTTMEVRWWCPTCDLPVGGDPEAPVFV